MKNSVFQQPVRRKSHEKVLYANSIVHLSPETLTLLWYNWCEDGKNKQEK